MSKQKYFSFSWAQFCRQPEYVFLVLSLVFGTIFLLVVPPFQVSDEPFHFLRTYQIATLDLIAEKRGDITGGELPAGLSDLIKIWTEIPLNTEKKATWEHFQNSWQIPLNKSQERFAWFSNTALYSPVPYIPQAMGIAVGKIFSLPPIILMYLGRISALLASTWVSFLAIKKTPFLKWGIVLILLTPMSIFLRAAVSADSFLIALSSLFVATCFDLAFQKQKNDINKWEVVFLGILSIAISLSKQVYFPLIFLFFLIPPYRFRNIREYFVTAGAFVSTSFLAALSWSLVTDNLYSSINPYAPNDPEQKIQFIFQHPIEFSTIVWQDFFVHIFRYLHQFIGILGWAGIDAPIPDGIWISYVLILIIYAVFTKLPNIKIAWWQKSGVLLVILAIIFLIYVSIFVTFVEAGKQTIYGIQGRYFYPVSFIFLFLLLNRKWQLPWQFKKWHQAAVFYILIALSSSIVVLLDRYYPI